MLTSRFLSKLLRGVVLFVILFFGVSVTAMGLEAQQDEIDSILPLLPHRPDLEMELDAQNVVSNTEFFVPIGIVNCSNPFDQLCDSVFSLDIKTSSHLQVQYLVPPSQCSSMRVHFFVDGYLVHTSNFLGWVNAPPPFADLPLDTGLIDLGPVPSGTHQLKVQAEGQTSGCNNGKLNSWSGTLKVVVSQAITIVKEANPADGQDFSFTGDLGNFTLDVDEDVTLPSYRVFESIPVGTYTVTEDKNLYRALWGLISVTCEGNSEPPEVDLVNSKATITLKAGEDVVCTFRNERATLSKEFMIYLPLVIHGIE